MPSEIGLLGRGFVDVGSLSDTATPRRGEVISDTSRPRVSAGVGVSWRSPFGLINIDVARPIAKERFDETQTVRFGFGTRF